MRRATRLGFICAAFGCLAWGQSYNIATVAGDGSAAFAGDSGPAAGAGLAPVAVTLDSAGNVYIADQMNGRIRKVAGGTISTLSQSAASPAGVAVDSSGDVYFSDSSHNSVYKLSGTTATVAAGTGSAGFSGDTAAATKATLNAPSGLAVDASGNLYIADTKNHRIRKVTAATGIITTVAGSSTSGGACTSFEGDGGAPTAATLCSPSAIALDSAGNLYIADTGNNRIRKAASTIATIAGGATAAFSGDNGPATSALLSAPAGVAVDASGNVYISDTGNNRIRRISGGTIETIGGLGPAGFSGDKAAAVAAELSAPKGLAVSSSGVWFADTANYRVRELTALPTAAGAPSITPGGVVPVYSTSAVIQPGEWVSIYGTNLAPATAQWNGDFPTSLAGTSVTIDGKPAYLWFVSPGQINLQAPADTATGPVPVVVTNPSGSSTAIVTLAAQAPSFSLIDATHVAAIAIHSDGSYSIVGPTASSLTPAKAGDTLELYGVGFGPTTAAVTPGQLLSAPTAAAGSVSVSIGNTSVTPTYAGMVVAGLYQINVPLPAGLGTGDIALTASVNGVKTQTGVTIALQDPVPPPVTAQSLTLTPSAVYAGSSTTAKVTLSGPAPASGASVAVGYATSYMSGPYSVIVSPGATSATFTVTVSASLSASISGTIQASYGGGIASATLTMVPLPYVTGLSFPPGTLATGSTATGTVTLSAAAPSGGTPVQLSSSAPSVVSVPASVTVPAGATTATFTASAASGLSSLFSSTITATAGNRSASASLSVSPPVNPNCATVGGLWNVYETGTVSETIVAAGQPESQPGSVYGGGSLTINQNGCSISWSALSSTDVGGDTAALARNGTVSGNNVTATGQLASLSGIIAAEEQYNPGLTVSGASASVNVLNASGTVSGEAMVLNETGSFQAAGNFSYEGESGPFTISITSNSTASFSWATGQRPQAASGGNHALQVQITAPGRIGDLMRRAIEKAMAEGRR
jgi:uncharacterized protein (TIGR03437 family)